MKRKNEKMKKKKIKAKKIKVKSAKNEKEISQIRIVKRKGHMEIYDERKIYGSCYFACRNAHLSEEEAEAISGFVTASVTKWISRKRIVTSSEIFRNMLQELRKHNEDAAFLCETHRDIS